MHGHRASWLDPEIRPGTACSMSAKSSLPIFGCDRADDAGWIDHGADFRHHGGLFFHVHQHAEPSRMSTTIST